MREAEQNKSLTVKFFSSACPPYSRLWNGVRPSFASSVKLGFYLHCRLEIEECQTIICRKGGLDGRESDSVCQTGCGAVCPAMGTFANASV